eukprot:TRINITY_DN4725_c0_g1_i1.p1 TRINITY_DN4725_c0_g1~~TRINITY_DN4725_c0_g1_i1.p1  ORF type:complete len:557 (+),score=91.28 TRINITY_DN4725_c0_g1_i1:119-1789(+)
MAECTQRRRSRARISLRAAELERVRREYDATPVLDSMPALQQLLRRLGQYVSDQELLDLMDSLHYSQRVHGLGFSQLCHLMELLKQKAADETFPDTVEAFAALGGRKDRQGDVDTDRLRREIGRFELTIDIDAMISEADQDGSGLIDYEEFSSMFDTDLADDGLLPGVPSGQGRMPSFSALNPGGTAPAAVQKPQPRPEPRAQRKAARCGGSTDSEDTEGAGPTHGSREERDPGLDAFRADHRDLRRLLSDTQQIEERLAAMRVDRDRDTRKPAPVHAPYPPERGWLDSGSGQALGKQRGRRGNVAFLRMNTGRAQRAPHTGLRSRIPLFDVRIGGKIIEPRRRRRSYRNRSPACSKAQPRAAPRSGSPEHRRAPVPAGCGPGGGLRVGPIPALGGGHLSPGRVRQARRACHASWPQLGSPPQQEAPLARPATQAARRARHAAPAQCAPLLPSPVRQRASTPQLPPARAISWPALPPPPSAGALSRHQGPHANSREISQCAQIALMGMDEIRTLGSSAESPRVLAGAEDPLLAAARRVCSPRSAVPPLSLPCLAHQ